MSYCRFSTDNFRCQLYVYAAHPAGYRIHTAGNKIVGDIPAVPPLSTLDPDNTKLLEDYTRSYREQMEFISTAKRENLPFPSAGMTFDEPDLEALLARLYALRDEGFEFPDFVIEAIKEEINEQ